MKKQIDYYCTSISPFTYLGHTRLLELADDLDTLITFKPIIISKIFAESGALPVNERPQPRQKYRLLEIERWAKKRELPVNLHPAFFPANPSLADRCVIALQITGEDAGSFLGHALAACWAEQKNIAEPSVIQDILNASGHNGQEILKLAESTQIQDVYATNTQDAIQEGVLGAPSYVLEGEQFWGQDRLELLADTLREHL